LLRLLLAFIIQFVGLTDYFFIRAKIKLTSQMGSQISQALIALEFNNTATKMQQSLSH